MNRPLRPDLNLIQVGASCHPLTNRIRDRDPTPLKDAHSHVDPIYETVIHEAALRIKVGGRPAFRAQLTCLLDLSEADHITVRVIPFDLDDFPGAGGAMVHLGGPVPHLDTVIRDAPHGTAFLDSEAQLEHFRRVFRRVREASLAPDRSRDLIHRLTKEL